MHTLQSSHTYPEVLDPHDLSSMGEAMVLALERLRSDGRSVETEAVARLVLRLYRRGLVEPRKLAEVVVLFCLNKLCSCE